MDNKKTDEYIDHTPLLSSNVKWVVGAIAGIGTGLAQFVTNVRAEFHENIVKGPDFQKTLKDHRDVTHRIKSERRSNHLTTEEFISQTHDEKTAFAKKVEEFGEELGIISHGPKEWVEGSLQRYRTLSAHTRIPIVFGSVSTAVIGFAGTSMFMNSLANRKKIDTIAKHNQTDPNQNPPQR